MSLVDSKYSLPSVYSLILNFRHFDTFIIADNVPDIHKAKVLEQALEQLRERGLSTTFYPPKALS